jgi:hypothetical protein
VIAPALPPDGAIGGGYHLVRQGEVDWRLKGPKGEVLVRFSTPTSDASGAQRFYRSAKGDVLLADRLSSSNGMGLDTWRLVLLHLAGGPVVQLESTDWGPDGVRERAGHLEVLAGDWVWPNFGKPKESYHFLGAWFAYEGNQLRPTGPWLARPYLFSFEAERGASSHDSFWYSSGWLRPGKARPYPGGDPRLGAESAPRVKGRLADVQLEAGGVRARLGQPFWLQAGEAGPKGLPFVNYVGIGGVLMPAAYLPGDVKAWEGRPAELATYGPDLRVLWLNTK